MKNYRHDVPRDKSAFFSVLSLVEDGALRALARNDHAAYENILAGADWLKYLHHARIPTEAVVAMQARSRVEIQRLKAALLAIASFREDRTTWGNPDHEPWERMRDYARAALAHKGE